MSLIFHHTGLGKFTLKNYCLLRWKGIQSHPASCNFWITGTPITNSVGSHFLKSIHLQPAGLFHTTKHCYAFDEVEKGDQYCISLDELKKDVENDDVLIVDVRRPDEVEAGRIPSKRFIHIPVQEVAEAFQMSNSEFKSTYGIEKPDKGADDIVFHCLVGGRSTFALRIAQTLGYSKSRHFPGGWREWNSQDT